VISVVVATYNRRDLLERTLQALEEQTLPRDAFEVIVADNGSSDDTQGLLERFRHEHRLNLRALRVTHPGKSAALNVAALQARGDVIVLTDDDVVPEREWLEAFEQTFRDPKVDFAAGRILPLWELPPPEWLSPAIYGVLAIPDGGSEQRPLHGLRDDIMPIGANMAVRRRVIEELGGWRTDLGKLRGTMRTGEDHEFYLRMVRAGCRGMYEARARVRHLVPGDRLRRSYFRRWFRANGRIAATLEHDFPTTTKYVLGVPRYLWRNAAMDSAEMVRQLLSRDAAPRFATRMRLLWFLGYLQQCSTARYNPAPKFSSQTSSSY
jgi:glycosyltransferase involved in cell wall biosynthesis